MQLPTRACRCTRRVLAVLRLAHRRLACGARRAAAAYGDGCEGSCGPSHLKTSLVLDVSEAELAADMARFCVRYNMVPMDQSGSLIHHGSPTHPFLEGILGSIIPVGPAGPESLPQAPGPPCWLACRPPHSPECLLCMGLDVSDADVAPALQLEQPVRYS